MKKYLMAAVAAGAMMVSSIAAHAEAVTLYATRLLGQQEGDWRITGIDPEGADLRAGPHVARLDFPERITGPGALRSTLANLSKEARAAIRPQP